MSRDENRFVNGQDQRGRGRAVRDPVVRGEMTITEAQLANVERLIEPSVAAMGFRLVQLRATGGTSRPTLQVMAERQTDGEMNIDDCAELSRTISAILDVEDPIASGFVLEVSSPGIDRPLVRLDDFSRFAGFAAKIELRRLIDGRRRHTGTLRGVDGGQVLIEVEGRAGPETVAVAHGEIARAKLQLTDELIAATLKKRKH